MIFLAWGLVGRAVAECTLVPPDVSPVYLEEHGSVAPDLLHADRLVEPDCRSIVGAHEERDRRRRLEQQPAEVAQPALAAALPTHLGIHPHLLDLPRLRRPRRRLGLEPDDAALEPHPRAAVLDLGARAPAKAVGVALERVDAELLGMRGGADRNEELEIDQ